MTDSVFVSYAADGVTITGIYTAGQTFPTTQVAADDPSVQALMNPAKPQTVLSQDMMAQFTPDDAAKIQAAVDGNVQFWLLWSSLQAQKDPMFATNARFLAGWSALAQVLGQPRMDAIAVALNVTITP